MFQCGLIFSQWAIKRQVLLSLRQAQNRSDRTRGRYQTAEGGASQAPIKISDEKSLKFFKFYLSYRSEQNTFKTLRKRQNTSVRRPLRRRFRRRIDVLASKQFANHATQTSIFCKCLKRQSRICWQQMLCFALPLPCTQSIHTTGCHPLLLVSKLRRRTSWP